MSEKDNISRRNFLRISGAAGLLQFLPKTTYSSSADLLIYSQPIKTTEENETPQDYSNISLESSDSRRRVIHPFQKGDTVGELRFHYGDDRHEKEILGDYDAKKIPIGAEIDFLADKDRFEKHSLTPDPREYGNWDAISQMDHQQFLRMISDFSYRGDLLKHIRLIPGLVPGDFEKNIGRQAENLKRLRDIIYSSAEDSKIDPLTLAAIAWQESRFRACTISTSGAMGTFQFTKDTASRKDFGGEINPYDEVQSAKKGASFLRHLSDICQDFPGLELVGYNIGGGAVTSIVKIAKELKIRNLDGILADTKISIKQEARDYPKKIAEAKEKIARDFSF